MSSCSPPIHPNLLKQEVDVNPRKVSNCSTDSSLTSVSEEASEEYLSYIPPTDSIDSRCYLPTDEPYPAELDNYIVIEDPAEAFNIGSDAFSYWKSKTEMSDIKLTDDFSTNTTANLTVPCYDWSTTNHDYRETCNSFSETESVYSSINSTVSEYEYSLPDSDGLATAETARLENSPPDSPQPAKLETIKTLDMIIDDIMNTPIVAGSENIVCQTDDGLPAIGTILNGWQT